jgi:UDP-N-acetylmuramyl pentapeptide phosphotransferase/UDP-N-acetylglucosamine-1-phosphate transferase
VAAVNLVWPSALAALALLVAEREARHLSRADHPLAVTDIPNARSLHDAPRTRTGGLAIHAGWGCALVGWLALRRLPAGSVLPAPTGSLWWLLGAAVVAGVVSFRDDVRSIPATVRFPAHLAMAAALALGGGMTVRSISLPALGVLPLGVLAIPLTVIGLSWTANLYNFMDGMDGFAGGMSVFGFACVAVLCWRGGAQEPALLALLVAAASLGFLRHNFPPARLFMGDVGAIPLGFLAGALAIWGAREGAFPLWSAVIAFSPFVVDATVTLLRRVLRGERAWQAHRSHVYQRLVLAGWPQRRTVLTEYALMAAAGLAALGYREAGPAGRAALLAAGGVAYAALLLVAERYLRSVGR